MKKKGEKKILSEREKEGGFGIQDHERRIQRGGSVNKSCV